MQPLGWTGQAKTAYRNRLYGSHDFDIRVDVLNMNERVVGSAVFLDGQVNLHTDTHIRRTATLELSDLEGAWDWAGESAWGDSKWAKQMLRVRHVLRTPEGVFTTTPFVGPVSAITRSGADVSVELQDKSALGMRGTKPFTMPKGAVATDAIMFLLQATTGEFRFRIPRKTKRLSRPYSVGWSDEAAPWLVAKRIARHQLGMQLIMSCDGYVTLRKRPAKPAWTIPEHAVTGLPTASVDYTDLVNWVRALGRKSEKQLAGGGHRTSQPEAIARIPAGQPFSPQDLARNGVPRFWPLLVEDSELTNLADVRQRANDELIDSSRLLDRPGITCVPAFHFDVDDIVQVETAEGSVNVRLGDASIPLGVGGDMTIGTRRKVSGPNALKMTSRTRRSTPAMVGVKRNKKRKNKQRTGSFSGS